MDVQQDFKVDKDIVTRLIYRIIMDEKRICNFHITRGRLTVKWQKRYIRTLSMKFQRSE